MFLIIIIVIWIESSDFVVEEIVDDQLVDVIGQFLVFWIFKYSESGESFDFLQNFSLIIKSLNGIVPTSWHTSLLYYFENNSVSLEKSLLPVDLMKS